MSGNQEKASQTLLDIMVTIDDLERRIEEILESNGGEVTEEVDVLFDELAASELEGSGKLDRYAWVMRRLLGEAEIIKERAAALYARGKTKENTVDRMKRRVQIYLDARGITKVEGDDWTVSVQNNGGLLPLILAEGVDMRDVPGRFQKHIVDFDKDAIRTALGAGEELPFASLGERGRGIRMK